MRSCVFGACMDNRTLLIEAANTGNSDAVRDLMAVCQPSDMSAALEVAISRNYQNCVMLLLPESDLGRINNTLVLDVAVAACAMGYSAGLKFLLPRLSRDNSTAVLQIAAQYGQSECLQLLIPVSDPKVSNSRPLWLAARCQHTTCVDLLFPVSDVEHVFASLQRECPLNSKFWGYLEHKICQHQQQLLSAEIASVGCVSRGRKM